MNFANSWNTENLCLQCGLCCNGAIFGDLKLRPGENVRRLNRLAGELALPPKGAFVSRRRISQPCPAFDGAICGIYSERPRHCRHFECAILKSAKAGELSIAAAQRRIQLAKALLTRVDVLLQKLGETDAAPPLALRLRRCRERLETTALDNASAKSCAQLTVAYHKLTCVLDESFYPGNAQGSFVT